jgi:ribosomal-protein-alanine N-acetyltransferase
MNKIDYSKYYMDNFLLESNRLIIRKLIIEDAELLFKYSQEDITKQELPDEVFENVEKTKETVKYLISNYDNKYPLVYGIILKEKNIIIGHINLSIIDKGIEIGYAIATDYQNKGYASELIVPFTSWAKENFKLENIYGIVKLDNIPSWKILERNGFSLLEEKKYKKYFNGEYITRIYVK